MSSGPHRKDLPRRGRGCVRLSCGRFLRGTCFGAWRERNGGRAAQKPVALEVPAGMTIGPLMQLWRETPLCRVELCPQKTCWSANPQHLGWDLLWRGVLTEVTS